MGHWLTLLFAVLCAASLHAAIDPYEFKSETDRHRFQRFVEDMRCPKCQNQNLAGSDAPIAADLRRELHRLLSEGRSDREIVDHMVARYGDYILYDPQFNKKTLFLWLAPALFASIGLVIVMVTVRRHRPQAEAPAALSAEEEQRLRRLLADDQKPEERP